LQRFRGRRRLVGLGFLFGSITRLPFLAGLGVPLGRFLLGRVLLCLLAALGFDLRADARLARLVGGGNTLLVLATAAARWQSVGALDLAVRTWPRLLAGCRGIAAKPATTGQQRQSGNAEHAAQNAAAVDPFLLSPHRRHPLSSPENTPRLLRCSEVGEEV
jgi:hypothetical protein